MGLDTRFSLVGPTKVKACKSCYGSVPIAILHKSTPNDMFYQNIVESQFFFKAQHTNYWQIKKSWLYKKK